MKKLNDLRNHQYNLNVIKKQTECLKSTVIKHFLNLSEFEKRM